MRAQRRGAVFEHGRPRPPDPPAAELASADFGTGDEAVRAGRAQAAAARPAHSPLLLLRLPELLAAHFDMTPDALRDLALRLSNTPQGGRL